MGDESEPSNLANLIVTLEAKTEKFEAALARASKRANDFMRDMERLGRIDVGATPAPDPFNLAGYGISDDPHDTPFAVGDVVVVRGQTQCLTVADVCGCGTVLVVWFTADGSLYEAEFDADMLVNLDLVGEDD